MKNDNALEKAKPKVIDWSRIEIIDALVDRGYDYKEIRKWEIEKLRDELMSSIARDNDQSEYKVYIQVTFEALATLPKDYFSIDDVNNIIERIESTKLDFTIDSVRREDI